MTNLHAHPLALGYPAATKEEIDRVARNMKLFGFDQRFPIVLYESQILDGLTRQAAADQEGVHASYIVFEGDSEAARRFVQVANEDRRHLTPAFLAQRRAERINRVAEARAQGESTRTIAEREGVSQKTIVGDTKKISGDTPHSPDTNDETEQVYENDTSESSSDAPGPDDVPPPPKTTGKDGKRYEKKKPNKPKNGKPVFSDSRIDKILGELARLFDDRGSASGKTAKYRACTKAIDALGEAWEAWKKDQK